MPESTYEEYFAAYNEVYKVEDNSGSMEILIRKLAETEVLIDEAETDYESAKHDSEDTKLSTMYLKRLADLRTAKNQLIRACGQRMGHKVSYEGVGNAGAAKPTNDMIHDYIE